MTKLNIKAQKFKSLLKRTAKVHNEALFFLIGIKKFLARHALTTEDLKSVESAQIFSYGMCPSIEMLWHTL